MMKNNSSIGYSVGDIVIGTIGAPVHELGPGLVLKLSTRTWTTDIIADILINGRKFKRRARYYRKFNQDEDHV